MIAGTLEIQLLADMARLRKDMADAKGVVGSAMAGIESAVASARGALAALGLGLSVGAMVAFTKSVIDATAKFKDLGQEAGVTASAISKFEEPARKAGSSTDFVASAMFRMTKAVIEARDPQSKAAQALAAIGISTSQLKGLKPDEMFELIARQSAKFGGSIDKNAVMMELFNKSGREMNKVAEEIAATGKLVATVTDEEAEAADRLQDQMVELHMNSEKFWRALIGQGVPAMNEIIRAFIDARREGGLFGALVAGLSTAFDHLFGKTVQLQILETDREIEKQIKLMKDMKENADAFGATDAPQQYIKEVGEQTRILNELLQKRLGLEHQLRGEPFAGGSASAEKPEVKFNPAATAAAAKALEIYKAMNAELDKEIATLRGVGEVEAFIAKLEETKYKDLTPKQKQELIDKEKLLVGLKQEKEAREAIIASNAALLTSEQKTRDLEEDYAISLRERLKDEEFQNTLIGKSAEEVAKLNVLRQMDLNLLRQIAQIERERGGQLGPEDEARIRRMREANELAKAGIVITMDEAKAQRESLSIWNQMGDALGGFLNALTHGFKSAIDFTRQLLKQLLAEMIGFFAKRWVLQLGASLLGGSATGNALAAQAGQVGAGTVGGSLLNAGGSLLGAAGNYAFGGTAFGAALGSGVGASMSTLGIAYQAGAGAVGGLGAVAGAALNLVPVIGLAVTAIYALYQAFKDTGENWRATLGFGANAQAYTHTGPFGAEGFQSIQGNDALNRQIQAFFASTGAVDTIIASTLSADTIARITANLAGPYTHRNDGQPAQFAFSADDQSAMPQLTLEYLQKKYGTIFDEIDKTFADWIRSYTGDSAGLLQAIAEFSGVIRGIADSGIPGLTLDGLRNMQRAGESLAQTFAAVTSGIQTYNQLFLSETERNNTALGVLKDRFHDLGLEMPTTREGFRALIDSIDHNSPLYRALIELAPAFAALVPPLDLLTSTVNGLGRAGVEAANALGRAVASAFQFGHVGNTTITGGGNDQPDFENSPIYRRDAANIAAATAAEELAKALKEVKRGLRDWLDSLLVGDLSPLSPMEKLAAAKSTFEKDLALAKGGDLGAASRIQGDSEAYLRIARDVFASSSAYASIFKQVFDQVSGFAGGPDFNTRSIEIQTAISQHLSNIYTQSLRTTELLDRVIQSSQENTSWLADKIATAINDSTTERR